jgi:hypothetical protein
MIALNIEGERIVNKAMEIRRANKLKLIDSIRLAIVNLDINIELAKGCVINAYQLMQESLSHTFICVDGLEPLVVNEPEDAKNYNYLSIGYDQLYEDIYVQLFILEKEKLNGTNILSFQRARIHCLLRRILSEICLSEPL